MQVTQMNSLYARTTDVYVATMKHFGWESIYTVVKGNSSVDLAWQAVARFVELDYKKLVKLAGVSILAEQETEGGLVTNAHQITDAIAKNGCNLIAMLVSTPDLLQSAAFALANKFPTGLAVFGNLDMQVFKWNSTVCPVLSGWLVPDPWLTPGWKDNITDALVSGGWNISNVTCDDTDPKCFTRDDIRINSRLAYAYDLISVYATAIDRMVAEGSQFDIPNIVAALRATTVRDQHDELFGRFETLSGGVKFLPSGERLQHWALLNTYCDPARGDFPYRVQRLGLWEPTSNVLYMDADAKSRVYWPGNLTRRGAEAPLDRRVFNLGIMFDNFGALCTFDVALKYVNQDLAKNPFARQSTPIKFLGYPYSAERGTETRAPYCCPGGLPRSNQLKNGTCPTTTAKDYCPINGSKAASWELKMVHDIGTELLVAHQTSFGAIGVLGSSVSAFNARFSALQKSSPMGFPVAQVEYGSMDPTLPNLLLRPYLLFANPTGSDAMFVFVSLMKACGWRRAGVLVHQSDPSSNAAKFAKSLGEQMLSVGLTLVATLETDSDPNLSAARNRQDLQGRYNTYANYGISINLVILSSFSATFAPMRPVGELATEFGVFGPGRATLITRGFTQGFLEGLCGPGWAQGTHGTSHHCKRPADYEITAPAAEADRGMVHWAGTLIVESWPSPDALNAEVKQYCNVSSLHGFSNVDLYKFDDWFSSMIGFTFNAVWAYYKAVRNIIEASPTGAGWMTYNATSMIEHLRKVDFHTNYSKIRTNFPSEDSYAEGTGKLKNPKFTSTEFLYKIRNLQIIDDGTVPAYYKYTDVGAVSTAKDPGDVRWTRVQEDPFNDFDLGARRAGAENTTAINPPPAWIGIHYMGNSTTMPGNVGDCKAGWEYKHSVGSTGCGPCSRGKYASKANPVCIECPIYATTLQNQAVNISQCTCQIGTYRPAEDGFACKLCPTNYGCPLGGVKIAEPGYWMACNEPTDACGLYECPVKSQCKYADSKCASHTEGVMCTSCKDGYGSLGYGNECTECPSVGTLVALFFVSFAIGLAYVVYMVQCTTNPKFWATQMPRLAILTIWIDFFQMISYYRGMNFLTDSALQPAEWFPPIPSSIALYASGGGMFSTMFLTFDCHATLEHLYAGPIAAGIMPTAVVGILTGIGLWLQHQDKDIQRVELVPHVETKNDRLKVKLWATAICLCFVFGPPALELVMMFFACTVMDDKFYNIHDYNVQCLSGGHLIVGLLVVVPMLVIAIVLAPWKGHRLAYHSLKDSLTQDPRKPELVTTQALGALFMPFEKDEFAHFVLVYARKVVLIAVEVLMVPFTSKIQGIAALVVLNVGILFHFSKAPFFYDDSDYLASIALLIAQTYLVLGILATELGDEGIAGGTMIFLELLFAGCAIRTFWRNSPVCIGNRGKMDETRDMPTGLGGDEGDSPSQGADLEFELNNMNEENEPLSPLSTADVNMSAFENKWQLKIENLHEEKEKRRCEQAAGETRRRRGPSKEDADPDIEAEENEVEIDIVKRDSEPMSMSITETVLPTIQSEKSISSKAIKPGRVFNNPLAMQKLIKEASAKNSREATSEHNAAAAGFGFDDDDDDDRSVYSEKSDKSSVSRRRRPAADLHEDSTRTASRTTRRSEATATRVQEDTDHESQPLTPKRSDPEQNTTSSQAGAPSPPPQGEEQLAPAVPRSMKFKGAARLFSRDKAKPTGKKFASQGYI
eukprot:TRINITY_DN3733_c0_g1_i9.p1 TRINITY_DN3733_c0_g1~~TRINITY_DN3733_c0_g1_i9.p1  ORF type:complete len:1711 (+),score=228.26 TRINITY_DN3733_c0_g1_i9:524-5656(+)